VSKKKIHNLITIKTTNEQKKDERNKKNHDHAHLLGNTESREQLHTPFPSQFESTGTLPSQIVTLPKKRYPYYNQTNDKKKQYSEKKICTSEKSVGHTNKKKQHPL
jgi:hypothetical protein